MGVPAFFRWLSRKYPSIIVNAVEEKPRDLEGTRIPVDCTKPNPNFQEFDNLYLDMNGIIHPCTHPEDRPAPKTEDEMFVLIFEYIDRMFSIVRPRRLLYMAIDGVAPRAKMNQQRSRRFRASKELADRKKEIADVRARLEREGFPLPPPRTEEQHFDSNCITPGTPFMARLADALRYYVHQRLNSDPAWAKIQVILSDANVPGEGEHKIMDYIRKQRASPGHDPNTVHCLCGADADLIMLGLATHEPNFNIVREEFVPNQQKPCELCGQYGHELNACQGLAREEIAPDQADPLTKEKNFIFLRLPVLREYLAKELVMPNLPFKYDFERAIDDWVFMCFFVGNDFLPHLPSLEIRENAIDRLIKLYKEMVYKTNGYLTQDGNVFMQRVQVILNELGEAEDEIFKRRQQSELQFRAKNKVKRRRERSATAPAWTPTGGSLLAPRPLGGPDGWNAGQQVRNAARDARVQAMNYSANEDAARQLKSMLRPAGSGAQEANSKKRSNPGRIDSDSEEEPHDEVRLWEDGWKERYYQSKFEVSSDDYGFRRQVAWAYSEGLCWVLRYYYQGCASWDWYFPYHYAPFASDFDRIADFKPDFSRETAPFKPLEQLMAVFPAASRAHLPESWHFLLTDSESPIIDFYPEDFQIDLNGKKFAWQGVALLPFVDEQRLLSALEEVYDKLDSFEKARNQLGRDSVFIGCHHAGYKFFIELFNTTTNDGNGEEIEECAIAIDPQFTYGMSGLISIDPRAVRPNTCYKSPVPDPICPDIRDNQAVMLVYSDPKFDTGFVFPATRLSGAKELPATLKPGDWDNRRDGQYRPQIGFSRDMPRASFGAGGQRMLDFEVNEMRNRDNRDEQRYGGRGRYNGGGGDNRDRSHNANSGWRGGGGYGNQQPQDFNRSRSFTAIPPAQQQQQQSYRQRSSPWGYGQQQQQPHYNQNSWRQPAPYSYGGNYGNEGGYGGGNSYAPSMEPPSQPTNSRYAQLAPPPSQAPVPLFPAQAPRPPNPNASDNGYKRPSAANYF